MAIADGQLPDLLFALVGGLDDAIDKYVSWNFAVPTQFVQKFKTTVALLHNSNISYDAQHHKSK